MKIFSCYYLVTVLAQSVVSQKGIEPILIVLLLNVSNRPLNLLLEVLNWLDSRDLLDWSLNVVVEIIVESVVDRPLVLFFDHIVNRFHVVLERIVVLAGDATVFALGFLDFFSFTKKWFSVKLAVGRHLDFFGDVVVVLLFFSVVFNVVLNVFDFLDNFFDWFVLIVRVLHVWYSIVVVAGVVLYHVWVVAIEAGITVVAVVTVVAVEAVVTIVTVVVLSSIVVFYRLFFIDFNVISDFNLIKVLDLTQVVHRLPFADNWSEIESLVNKVDGVGW